MYTGEQDRTLGNHVGWTLMKCNKTEHCNHGMDTHEMYTGEQDRTLGNHVGWTLMKCILGNKTEH